MLRQDAIGGGDMALYTGVDLHSSNCCFAVMDEEGKKVYGQRIGNDLELVLRVLEPYREETEGVVVESTYNWY